MSYDDELSQRIRHAVQDEPGLSEMRMFGGVAFLIDGKLAVGASGMGGMMTRIDPTLTGSAVGEPHVRPFEMRGRKMIGWLSVDADALTTDDELLRWVEQAVTYARALAAKQLLVDPGTGAARGRALP